ncbi:MAG TPA: hypothetical protein VG106_12970, partial [Vicinamibacterales bacterium]|nr:hypothetical protein [Vicinamibacterales bacterium]
SSSKTWYARGSPTSRATLQSGAAASPKTIARDGQAAAHAVVNSSGAIVFGDAAAPDWSVTRLVGDPRAYHVFEELNTYTAVVYLKKVNHPQPAAQ